MRSIWAQRDWSLLRPWTACLVVLLAAVVVLPGCGSCRRNAQKTEAELEAERLAAEREKKKPDFEIRLPISQPADEKLSGCRVKPGHWAGVLVEAKANKNDFVGDLEIGILGDDSRVVGLEAVPYARADARGVALAKGRKKTLQASFFVPLAHGKVSGQLRLTPRGGGYRQPEQPFPLTRMLAHQYHFVVLARNPDRYAFVRTLDSVKPPRGEIDSSAWSQDYWVSLPKIDQQASLPDHALFWTSIAHVLWDDVEPKSLNADQQRALVDWLHWGGQLIVSGPDSLDSLRDSFLADYLPAKSAGPWELTPADFDELNAHFTLAGQKRLEPVGDWSGARLEPVGDARFVPGAGKLLVERRVGRGRVIVTAIRLSDRPMLTWPGFDNFFNGCLLRRPARRYALGSMGDLELHWADATLADDDPTLNCNLRFFTRDADVSKGEYSYLPDSRAFEMAQAGQGYTNPYGSSYSLEHDRPLADGPGVAAWRSFSPAANHARRSLQTAACVEVPGRWFVIWVVAIYLAVLVPLNWFVFAAIGRTEWAWAAAPIIAIAGTAAVVHLARLDIGFARSETHVGVIEIQGEHRRAHLTTYTALYTSLTTQYAFGQDDLGALVQPFPTVDRRQDFSLLPGQGLGRLMCRHDKNVELHGFSVPSNLVDFIHGEQMIDLDGSLSIARAGGGGWQLINRTGLDLHGVGLIRAGENNTIETAWVGDIGGLGIAKVTFVRPAATKPPWWPEPREKDEMTKETAEKGQINLRGLTQQAEDVGELRSGEIRLVGWTTQSVGGPKIAPSAPQSRRAALVVAHLGHARAEPPQSDVNTRIQPEPAPILEEEDVRLVP
ncbi:MAG: hypothetical protein GX621_08555 [Pirellulaceae bacterium]|nr:hypothetical protein [Pirellulaceae bacterium]